jgi:hypothetical protein
MSKHTPGPWEIVPEKNNPSYCHVYDVARRSLGQIATVHGTKGDAQLIAAAPELLEACKAALGHAQLLGSGQVSPMSNAELCNLLGSAIAKASPPPI